MNMQRLLVVNGSALNPSPFPSLFHPVPFLAFSHLPFRERDFIEFRI